MKSYRHLLLLAILLGCTAAGSCEPAGAGYTAYEDSAAWKPPARLPARKGDGAPDIALTDVLSSRTVNLSDFRGEILYLEFWATWCPACIPLMEKYDRVAGKHKGDWSGKVVIAAVSLDKNPGLPRRAVEANGWKHLRQLWSAMDLSGREALASKAFGIVDLPYAVLIDASGTVVWRGDPSRHSAEDRIAALLARSAAGSE